MGTSAIGSVVLKTCTQCHTGKPIDEFYKHGMGDPDKRHPWCKDCTKARTNLRRINNRDEIKKQERTREARKYGLTLDEAEKYWYQGACDVCGMAQNKANSDILHIDHCHTTDKIRGALCIGCNLGIGSFKDSPERLRAAAHYLEKARGDT
ncbi:endonuclease domain-containing protein [Nocardia sp. NPDC059246]|uniref:endonuclease domain-containing protein n=1 Tax=unclassified Nocardia TaxID=2637762 RepID=UPI00369B6D60